MVCSLSKQHHNRKSSKNTWMELLSSVSVTSGGTLVAGTSGVGIRESTYVQYDRRRRSLVSPAHDWTFCTVKYFGD
jgi:hypothetical protein